jgi:putative PIN family toxin of toxin-antitoxin system
VRAVLDPNVVISGLISRDGAPARLLASWRRGRFEVVVSPLLLAELGRALGYPGLRRRLPAEAAEAAVRWLADGATRAEDPPEHPPVRSSDPGDDYLIALAAHRNAALVSGDRHLLDFQGVIPVYSPNDFLALVERS